MKHLIIVSGILTLAQCGFSQVSSKHYVQSNVLRSHLLRQDLPYLTPKSLELARGAQFLLESGAPNPKGGEFRFYFAGIRQSRYKKSFYTTGWVFPTTRNGLRRVVDLNGYEAWANEIGPKADLLQILLRNFGMLRDSNPGSYNGHIISFAMAALAGQEAIALQVLSSLPNGSSIPLVRVIAFGRLEALLHSTIASITKSEYEEALANIDLLSFCKTVLVDEIKNGTGTTREKENYIQSTFQQYPIESTIAYKDDLKIRLALNEKPFLASVANKLPAKEAIDYVIESYRYGLTYDEPIKPVGLKYSENRVDVFWRNRAYAISRLKEVSENDHRPSHEQAMYMRMTNAPPLLTVSQVAEFDANRLGVSFINLSADQVGGWLPFYQPKLFHNLDQVYDTLLKSTEDHELSSAAQAIRHAKSKGLSLLDFLNKENPTVGELLVRHARRISNDSKNTSTIASLRRAGQLVDPSVYRELLKIESRTLEKIVDLKNRSFQESDYARVIVARLEIGDQSAADDYTKFVISFPMEKLKMSSVLLSIIGYYVDSPRFKRVRNWLYLSDSSPIRAGFGHDDQSLYLIRSLTLSPLLNDTSYRKLLIDLLRDTSKYCDIEVGSYGVHRSHNSRLFSSMTMTNFDLSDPLKPRANTVVPMRVCDEVAFSLRRFKGAPYFLPFWPEKKKDDALADIRKWLSQSKQIRAEFFMNSTPKDFMRFL